MGPSREPAHLVGLISDTHGLLRPQAVEALAGAELILHAGDIGGPEVLEELSAVAPVVAVRGNNDKGAWAEGLPDYKALKVGGAFVYVLHDVSGLDLNPEAAGFRVVVSGHSHRPSVREQRGVLYVNPGSAGPRRFKLPVSVALLRIGRDAEAEIVELSV